MIKEKAVEFLKGIKKTDGVIVIFNNDADGVCSCAIMKAFLERHANNLPYIISQPMPTDKNLLRKIQTALPTKIIFLDIAIDQQQNVLKKISGMCDILIIDHHQIFKDMNQGRVVHYNPRLEKPKIYQSTSYLTYKLCSEIINIEDLLWIAAVGIIGDYNIEDSTDIVEAIRKKYSVKDLYESYLGRIADMIEATKATKAMSCEQMVDVIKNTNNPESFDNEKMVHSFKEIDNEMMRLMIDAESVSERPGKLILYRIESKFNLASPLATRLSDKYQDRVVVIYEINRGNARASARNQSRKYDVGKILQKASAGMKASAGGHEAAAGATLLEKDWMEFRERLIRLVK